MLSESVVWHGPRVVWSGALFDTVLGFMAPCSCLVMIDTCSWSNGRRIWNLLLRSSV